MTTTDLAVIGATIANAGTNPLTGKRAVEADNVPHILTEMTMEGLYEASGDWAYTVSLPGKSCVGGGLLAIVPGVLAIAAFAPPLDPHGNSVRAQLDVTHIAHTLGLGLYLQPGPLVGRGSTIPATVISRGEMPEPVRA